MAQQTLHRAASQALVTSGMELFGEQLVAAGCVTPDQLRIALHEQQQRGGLLGEVLTRLGYIDAYVLCRSLAARVGWRHIAAAQLTPDLQLLRAIPHPAAQRWQMLPLRLANGAMLLACADPYDIIGQDQLRAHLGAGAQVEFVLAPATALRDAIARSYGVVPAPVQQAPEPGAVSAWLASLLTEAVACNASDIHLEPQTSALSVRLRIDGMLHQVKAMHRDFWPALLQRLKIVSAVNIAETRRPQDGRFSQICGGVTVDFRVGFLPTTQGEAVAIRILDPRMAQLPLGDMGFDPSQSQMMQGWLRRPEGLVLVTGPTGSGKSTTLHALLREIDRTTRNIMTLEDPVEYQFEGMRQTQVREQYGLGFAEGVRTMLRHDPDVILIGEIRDAATAQQAIRAAMTGHLVLSTLHTSNALGAIPRLLDLGVPRTLLAGNLRGVIAQRLVRKLCVHCRTMRPLAPTERAAFPAAMTPPLMIGVAEGCDACFGTGRHGRTMVAELVEFTTSHDVQEQIAARPGFDTMWRHGLSKVGAAVLALDDLVAAVPRADTDHADAVA